MAELNETELTAVRALLAVLDPETVERLQAMAQAARERSEGAVSRLMEAEQRVLERERLMEAAISNTQALADAFLLATEIAANPEAPNLEKRADKVLAAANGDTGHGGREGDNDERFGTGSEGALARVRHAVDMRVAHGKKLGVAVDIAQPTATGGE